MSKENRIFKISAAVLSIFAVALLLMASTRIAAAETKYSLSVPVTTIIRGSVGSVHELASKDVDQKYQGMVCDVNATAENQGSVHPGNNIIVSSNGNSVTLADVERSGGVITHADGKLELGSKVEVSLKMGQDKVFSGGMDLNITCVEPEIEVWRDGQVVTIKESERVSSDTELPCPSDVEVCRDGKVVAIKENERKESDKNAPCPEVLSKVKELPKTGVGIMPILAVVTSFFAGTALAQKKIRS